MSAAEGALAFLCIKLMKASRQPVTRKTAEFLTEDHALHKWQQSHSCRQCLSNWLVTGVECAGALVHTSISRMKKQVVGWCVKSHQLSIWINIGKTGLSWLLEDT